MPESSHASSYNPTIPGTGKNYLLAIAIDDYKHYNKLNNAVKDVTEIKDILVNLYQFEKQNLFTLFNEDATEDGIDEIFLELVDVVKKEDNLVIFFSGHGYFRPNVKEGYWVPVDGRKDKVSDYISNANLTRYIENIEAHHLLLVVDSCFSGALVEQLKGDTNSEGFPSRRVFASGREETTDGIPGENSPFAKGIIDFLTASLTTPEPVSTSALIESVGSHVKSKTGKEPIEGRLTHKDNKGEFFFKHKMSEEDLWKTAYAKGKMEDYEEFLSIFPDGAFSSDAREQIDKLHALIVWRKAEKGNTIDDYQDFIFLCSKSELVKRAKAKIEQLKKAEEQKRLIEEDRVKRIEEKEEQEKNSLRLIKEYEAAFADAQKAFKDKEYQKARSLLWTCDKSYRENKQELYVPEIGIITSKREECTKQIRCIEYIKVGRNAFKTKDFELAYAHFDAALAINNTEEIKRLRYAAHTLNKTKKSVTVAFSPQKKKGFIKIPPISIPNKEEAKKSSPSIKIKSKNGKPPTTNSSPPKEASKNQKIKISVPSNKREERRYLTPPSYQKRTLITTNPTKKKSIFKDKKLTWIWVTLLILIYLALVYALDLF